MLPTRRLMTHPVVTLLSTRYNQCSAESATILTARNLEFSCVSLLVPSISVVEMCYEIRV